MGRGSRRRRFYLFELVGAPAVGLHVHRRRRLRTAACVAFAAKWGKKGGGAEAVRPQLRVHVRPADFPLLDTVVELSSPGAFAG